MESFKILVADDEPLISLGLTAMLKTQGVTEAEAYRLIQQKSRNENIPMARIAEAIISSDQLSKKKRPERNRSAH